MTESEHEPFCEVVQLPTDRQPVIRIIPMPADTNAHGKVVTVSVNSFQFKQPVLVGDLVSFYADVVRVGRTSLTVDVEVYAQRQRFGAEVVKVTEAQLTYVAIDDQRKPRPVPEQKS